MGVTGSTGPVLDRDEVDRALARLGAGADAQDLAVSDGGHDVGAEPLH